MVIRTKDKHNVFTEVDITGQGNWMHESARAGVIFVAFWSSCSNVFVCAAKWGWVNSKSRSRFNAGLADTVTLNDQWFQSHTFGSFGSWLCWFLTNITWNGSFRGVGAREILKASRKRTFFSFVCVNVLHQVVKKALCFMSVLKSGWMSTSDNLPVSPVWSNYLPLLMLSSSITTNNFGLECEQDHEYLLNRIPFST